MTYQIRTSFKKSRFFVVEFILSTAEGLIKKTFFARLSS
jgi:hypothetical protein